MAEELCSTKSGLICQVLVDEKAKKILKHSLNFQTAELNRFQIWNEVQTAELNQDEIFAIKNSFNNKNLL